MSVDKNNQTYKKTSFLTGVNSDYIEEYYALYLQNMGETLAKVDQ